MSPVGVILSQVPSPVSRRSTKSSQKVMSDPDFSPTASGIPDVNRENVRRQLSMEHAVDTTRFNAPANMTRPPIGPTDAIFGGRDRSISGKSGKGSNRGESRYISKASYPRAPPIGPGSCHFLTNAEGHRFGHTSPRASTSPSSRRSSFKETKASRRYSTPPMPCCRAGHQTPPGMVTLDDRRWFRDIVPETKNPSGCLLIQQEEIHRRAMTDDSKATRRASRASFASAPSRIQSRRGTSASARIRSFFHSEAASRAAQGPMVKVHDPLPSPPGASRRHTGPGYFDRPIRSAPGSPGSPRGQRRVRIQGVTPEPAGAAADTSPNALPPTPEEGPEEVSRAGSEEQLEENLSHSFSSMGVQPHTPPSPGCGSPLDQAQHQGLTEPRQVNRKRRGSSNLRQRLQDIFGKKKQQQKQQDQGKPVSTSV
ncbi:MAG: hypothetical protein DHS80DRAFT_21620 [Piptocephalis tieghemiana]|nr:MAG: hypothetical protein DHS80DRAFT_21620 [Piptocephalis tieghemiana]